MLSKTLPPIIPRLQFADGGCADFAGTNGKIYNLFSCTNMSLSMLSVYSRSLLPGPRLMHDTVFTETYIQIRALNNVRLDIHMEANASGFVVYITECDKCSPRLYRKQHGSWQQLKYNNIFVFSKQFSTIIRCCGWQLTTKRLPIFQPLNDIKWKFVIYISELKNAYFYRRNRRKKYRIYNGDRNRKVNPHGLLGQSFDFVWNKSVSGEYLTYNKQIIVNTKKANGAIEGYADNYTMSTKFSTEFAYSRFNSFHESPHRALNFGNFSHIGHRNSRPAFLYEAWGLSFPLLINKYTDIMRRSGRHINGI